MTPMTSPDRIPKTIETIGFPKCPNGSGIPSENGADHRTKSNFGTNTLAAAKPIDITSNGYHGNRLRPVFDVASMMSTANIPA
jgi:hypothetical protein